jgi:methylenetetrahydrofolate--tRNA-(uracil-5-)-methyltransferase
MNINYGLFPPLAGRSRGRRDRRQALAERALADLESWWQTIGHILAIDSQPS